MTAKQSWRSVSKAHVGILQQALLLVGVSVACQWCQGNSTHRWKTHLLAQRRCVFNGMCDRMNFENPTPKKYDTNLSGSWMLHPVFPLCTVVVPNVSQRRIHKEKYASSVQKHPKCIVWYQIYKHTYSNPICFSNVFLVHNLPTSPATLHRTCKNWPMQAKVLVKSHRYLGTNWLTSIRVRQKRLGSENLGG